MCDTVLDDRDTNRSEASGQLHQHQAFYTEFEAPGWLVLDKLVWRGWGVECAGGWVDCGSGLLNYTAPFWPLPLGVFLLTGNTVLCYRTLNLWEDRDEQYLRGH